MRTAAMTATIDSTAEIITGHARCTMLYASQSTAEATKSDHVSSETPAVWWVVTIMCTWGSDVRGPTNPLTKATPSRNRREGPCGGAGIRRCQYTWRSARPGLMDRDYSRRKTRPTAGQGARVPRL